MLDKLKKGHLEFKVFWISKVYFLSIVYPGVQFTLQKLKVYLSSLL